jgi:hypothetical protein
MPKRINREQSTELSKPSENRYDVQISNAGLAAVGIGMTSLGVGMTAKAAAEVYSSTVNLIATTVHSLAECATAYANYAAECQRTRQVEIWSYTVLEEARERTHQMEVHAKAMVLAAREQTRRVELNAEITVAQIRDTQEARNARMEIVRYYLGEHQKLNRIFLQQNESGIQNLSIDERVSLTKYRDDVLGRLRDLETALGTLAKTL